MCKADLVQDFFKRIKSPRELSNYLLLLLCIFSFSYSDDAFFWSREVQPLLAFLLMIVVRCTVEEANLAAVDVT